MCLQLGDERFPLGVYPNFMTDESWDPEEKLILKNYHSWCRHDQLLIIIPLVVRKFNGETSAEKLTKGFSEKERPFKIYYQKISKFALRREEEILAMWRHDNEDIEPCVSE